MALGVRESSLDDRAPQASELQRFWRRHALAMFVEQLFSIDPLDRSACLGIATALQVDGTRLTMFRRAAILRLKECCFLAPSEALTVQMFQPVPLRTGVGLLVGEPSERLFAQHGFRLLCPLPGREIVLLEGGDQFDASFCALLQVQDRDVTGVSDLFPGRPAEYLAPLIQHDGQHSGIGRLGGHVRGHNQKRTTIHDELRRVTGAEDLLFVTSQGCFRIAEAHHDFVFGETLILAPLRIAGQTLDQNFLSAPIAIGLCQSPARCAGHPPGPLYGHPGFVLKDSLLKGRDATRQRLGIDQPMAGSTRPNRRPVLDFDLAIDESLAVGPADQLRVQTLDHLSGPVSKVIQGRATGRYSHRQPAKRKTVVKVSKPLRRRRAAFQHFQQDDLQQQVRRIGLRADSGIHVIQLRKIPLVHQLPNRTYPVLPGKLPIQLRPYVRLLSPTRLGKSTFLTNDQPATLIPAASLRLENKGLAHSVRFSKTRRGRFFCPKPRPHNTSKLDDLKGGSGCVEFQGIKHTG
jgi:hypothetical protein